MPLLLFRGDGGGVGNVYMYMATVATALIFIMSISNAVDAIAATAHR